MEKNMLKKSDQKLTRRKFGTETEIVRSQNRYIISVNLIG